MDLIIGGAYQGKLDYAKEKFNLSENDIFYCTRDAEIDRSKRCFYHFDEYLLYCVKNDFEPDLSYSDDTIIIMNDIFCGVVPVDKDLRAWRELCGRTGARFTREAKSVTRLFCGLPVKLKVPTQKIYLIRHGKTQANLDYVYCGKTDLSLIEDGINDIAAKKEKNIYPNINGLDLYTSSRKRTKETLNEIYGVVDSTPLPDFDEMDFGDFEMRAYSKDLESDPDFVIWTAGDNEGNVCPHGESNRIMTRRVLAAFDKVLENEKDALIVSHGGPIAVIFKKYFPDAGLNWYEIQPKNAEGYLFEFENKRAIKYTKIAE